MKKDNHIDPDIYDAFIHDKLYLKYAQKSLDKPQIYIDCNPIYFSPILSPAKSYIKVIIIKF